MTKPKSLSQYGRVAQFVDLNFPHPVTASLIARELEIKENTASQCLKRLLNRGSIQRPKGCRHTYYLALPKPDNIAGLEDPEVQLHDLTFYVSIKEFLKMTDIRGTPPSLYTHPDTYLSLAKIQDPKGEIDYWYVNNKQMKITTQYAKGSITIHVNCNREPVNQTEFWHLEAYLHGLLAGKGINMAVVDMELTKAEMGKDFERITITPKMLEIRDLKNKSWLRIYRKLRNVHRLEVGTTWEGDLALFDIFKNFGKKDLWQSDGDDDPAFQ